MTSSAPTLPKPTLTNGLNHIPPPPAQDFESEFQGILPKGKTIPSSWGCTRYYDFSPSASPSARKIILIHGAGCPAIGVAPLALNLTATGNHVVAYDLWGHGLSSTPLAPHTSALFHAQLLELLSFLKWDTFHILGFSFGGSVAATFAALHPNVIESVTLVAGAGLGRKSNRGWWQNLVFQGGWGLEYLSRKKIMAFINGSNPKVQPDWKERLLNGEVDSVVVETWSRENHKGHVASAVSMFRYGSAFDAQDSYERLAKTGVKALVVLGEKDVVAEPEQTKKELLKLGWVGEIKIIEGATHSIVRTHVREVAELVEPFLKSLED
jgi:pimeloyl-ACP methyl ester carboxylesterase